jgi:hypothetical protein
VHDSLLTGRERGNTLVLCGPPGSGKSSLLLSPLQALFPNWAPVPKKGGDAFGASDLIGLEDSGANNGVWTLDEHNNAVL